MTQNDVELEKDLRRIVRKVRRPLTIAKEEGFSKVNVEIIIQNGVIVYITSGYSSGDEVNKEGK